MLRKRKIVTVGDFGETVYLIPYQVPVLLAPMIIYRLDNNRRDTDVWRLLYRG